MNKSLLKTINIAIVSVYLIFLAGSIVRMTGSGMGCPDWPKCFGYYIPPTSVDELIWESNKEFDEGAIIIYQEKLHIAKNNVHTDKEFNAANWEMYTKHEYAEFNVYHTYTEYINRLSSVLSGFVFLALLWKVTFNKKKKKGVALLTYIAFGGMLFEAWLGKVVVDSFLTPYVITIHMIGGLFIIGLLLRAKFLINSENTIINCSYNKVFNRLLFSLLLLLVVQILVGTQVRQFVDEQVRQFGVEHKEFRLLSPSFKFYFHRSFTIVIVLISFFLFWLNYKYKLGYKQINFVILLLVFEAVTGILMYYVDFPFGTQAIHLLSGALLFGVILYNLFIASSVKKLNS